MIETIKKSQLSRQRLQRVKLVTRRSAGGPDSQSHRRRLAINTAAGARRREAVRMWPGSTVKSTLMEDKAFRLLNSG